MKSVNILKLDIALILNLLLSVTNNLENRIKTSSNREIIIPIGISTFEREKLHLFLRSIKNKNVLSKLSYTYNVSTG